MRRRDPPSSIPTPAGRRGIWLAVALPLAIFLAHGALFGAWIVDDAGISFAYARSLAEGHGLVSQPGAPPVEGFTNLLWVLLVALSMVLRLFDPLLTPKILSVLCVAGAFALLVRLLVRHGGRPPWLAAAACAVTAAVTGFTVWCVSGLENPLYVLLLAALAVFAAGSLAAPGALRRRAALCGVVTFLVSCARPDGLLYFWVPPLFLGWAEAAAAGTGSGERRPSGAWRVHAGAFALLWALLTGFRAAYFGDVLPNTFYAKKGEGAWFFRGLTAHASPLEAALVFVALGMAAMAVTGWASHRLGQRLGRAAAGPGPLLRHAAVPFALTAVIVHAALPGDWMGEYRFATPAFFFAPAALLGLLADARARVRAPRPALALAALALLGVAAMHARVHSARFARRPTISFSDVRQLSRRIADVLAPFGRRASVLTPDIGGALWEDRFRVIDYVGLVDRDLGRVVRRDPSSLRDHILEVRRPEAIWLHSHWLRGLDLEGDARFRDAYAPVWQERDPADSSLFAALYLRRDVAAVATAERSSRSAPPRGPRPRP